VTRLEPGAVSVAIGGGRMVAGRAAEPAELTPGAEVHVAVRPEDIAVDADVAGGNVLPGVIDALLFVGDRYEARVTVGSDQRIVLLLPRAREWKEGQPVSLAFPPDAVSVWPA
jgi:hypothetical protein